MQVETDHHDVRREVSATRPSPMWELSHENIMQNVRRLQTAAAVFVTG